MARYLSLEDRYRNGLEWLRMTAMLHYIGGAFDPEHMRSIANLAADVLGNRELPDFTSAMENAQAQASRMAQQFSELAGSDEGES